MSGFAEAILKKMARVMAANPRAMTMASRRMVRIRF